MLSAEPAVLGRTRIYLNNTDLSFCYGSAFGLGASRRRPTSERVQGFLARFAVPDTAPSYMTARIRRTGAAAQLWPFRGQTLYSKYCEPAQQSLHLLSTISCVLGLGFRESLSLHWGHLLGCINMQIWHRREYVVDQPSGTSDGAALMLSHAQRRRRAVYYSAPSALVTPTRSGLLCLSARTNLYTFT